MRKTLTAILLLLFTAIGARAQEWTDDAGSWISANVKASVAPRFSLEGRVEWRTQDSFSSTNQLFARACLAWKPLDWLRVDTRFDYGHYPSSSDKLRVIPGMMLSYKYGACTVYLRQWLMHSWDHTGSASSSDVLRTKVGGSVKISDTAYTPHMDYEVFYWDSTVTQQRFYLGTRVKLPQGMSLDVFYLYQILPLKYKGTHIAGLSWTYSIKSAGI